MSQIGTIIKDKKLGRGVVTKRSPDPKEKRFAWLVRFEKGALKWMSEKDIDALEEGAEKESEILDAFEE